MADRDRPLSPDAAPLAPDAAPLGWMDGRCRGCFERKLGELADRFAAPPDRGRVLAALWESVAALPAGVPAPTVAATALGRLVRETGVTDPFLAEKRAMNDAVLAELAAVRARVAAAPDPFAAAVRAAMAGNTLDIATPHSASLADTLERFLTAPLAVDHTALLRERAATAREVLVLADNAGEIVLDRLLVEALDGAETTVVVRGGPAWNDALRDDATAAGLDGVARVIDNGCALPGTVLADCRAEVRERFASADLVVAKGQGNYETLCNERRAGLFFVLLLKCEAVAEMVGAPLGAGVVLHAPAHP